MAETSTSAQSIWHFLRNWAILALGVLLAAAIVPGISYEDNATLLIVVVLLSLLNAVLRLLLILFTLPFVIFTLGFGIILINAGLFALTAYMIEGFVVGSFWSALGGAVVTGLVSFLSNLVLGTHQNTIRVKLRRRTDPKDDDVIDV